MASWAFLRLKVNIAPGHLVFYSSGLELKNTLDSFRLLLARPPLCTAQMYMYSHQEEGSVYLYNMCVWGDPTPNIWFLGKSGHPICIRWLASSPESGMLGWHSSNVYGHLKGGILGQIHHNHCYFLTIPGKSNRTRLVGLYFTLTLSVLMVRPLPIRLLYPVYHGANLQFQQLPNL